VAKLTSLQNTDPGAKAGLMIRESTSDDSKEASIVITPAQGVAFLARTSSSTTIVGSAAGIGPLPKWLMLVRSGTSFTAFYAPDSALPPPPGPGWTQVGPAKTISMNTSVNIGLAVTSHNDGTICLATFEGVTATP
jgi:hypothetical protein